MTENVSIAKAQTLAALERLAGKGPESRGRPALEILTDEDDDINISIIDIENGAVNVKSYRDASALEKAIQEEKCFRIISIYSESTIDPLEVSPHVLEKILSRYEVHSDFMHVVASFGDEPHLAESSCSNMAMKSTDTGDIEISYQIRYVEENFRKGMSNPWSFRHTGVYHKHSTSSDLFILLQPQQNATGERKLLGLGKNGSLKLQQCPFMLHELLFSAYFENWRWYHRYLADRFSSVNDLAMVVRPANAEAASSFERVQSLRNVNDFILFSSGCCRGDLEVLEGFASLRNHESYMDPDNLKSEITRMRGYIESADALQERIRNAIDLVGYTLMLHNQMETAKVDKELRDMTGELKQLTEQTVGLNTEMKKMTQDTIDDSVTVKIITFVSAFYIPGSFAGTLFGMNFFGFDAIHRRIVIANDFWIFIATWIPLTLITIGLYLFVVWMNPRTKGKRGAHWLWQRPSRSQLPLSEEKGLNDSTLSVP
ncbi:hypothetical protein NA57DRAFT_77504 [Rhizodiscina lignyota]|uniref:CorA-like transporter domain-containing protein n=1 Tax=Rhizodiscina lignyota TaxID=1504668 RepID=A0A9P4I914_9PEZI|nr:hypothetical protein NA57DRAFT_77504 [Rhizodiscina lignyota]